MPHSSTTRRVSALEGGARPPLRLGVRLAHHFTLSAVAVFIDHLQLAADEGDSSRPLLVQWSIIALRPESCPPRPRGCLETGRAFRGGGPRTNGTWVLICETGRQQQSTALPRRCPKPCPSRVYGGRCCSWSRTSRAPSRSPPSRRSSACRRD